MITRFRLPKLDTNMEEATVTGWLKREGDAVRKGEPLVELTTDKACVEAEAPRSATVLRVLAREKSILPVGYVLAILGAPGDAAPDVTAENEAVLAKHRKALAGASGKAEPAPAPRPPAAGGVRATPAARRVARELGVDLAALQAKLAAAIVDEAMVRAEAQGSNR